MKWYSSTERKKIFVCYNIDEPWKHYANERSQHRRPHIVWFHIYECPEQTQNSLGVPEGEKMNNWECTQIIFKDNENVQKLNFSDDCTILWT